MTNPDAPHAGSPNSRSRRFKIIAASIAGFALCSALLVGVGVFALHAFDR